MDGVGGDRVLPVPQIRKVARSGAATSRTRGRAKPEDGPNPRMDLPRCMTFGGPGLTRLLRANGCARQNLWRPGPRSGQGNRFWKSENQKGEHKKNFLALSLRS